MRASAQRAKSSNARMRKPMSRLSRRVSISSRAWIARPANLRRPQGVFADPVRRRAVEREAVAYLSQTRSVVLAFGRKADLDEMRERARIRDTLDRATEHHRAREFALKERREHMGPDAAGV